MLLSDGGDTGSSLTLDQVSKLATRAHVRIYSVGLRGRTFRPTTLQGLANATGGSFSEAVNTTELAAIYDQLGLKLANQYLVTYKSLVDPGTRTQVNVSVEGLAAPSWRTPRPRRRPSGSPSRSRTEFGAPGPP